MIYDSLIFGNVHGVYKPGHVKLRPELLGQIQVEEVGRKVGKERPFDSGYVWHLRVNSLEECFVGS